MITTNRGLVLGSMGCTQRQAEVRVVDFAMRKLGVRIVARIPNIEGMTLEGGDFVGYNSGMLEIDTVPYKHALSSTCGVAHLSLGGVELLGQICASSELAFAPRKKQSTI
jgi:arginine deiminase